MDTLWGELEKNPQHFDFKKFAAFKGGTFETIFIRKLFYNFSIIIVFLAETDHLMEVKKNLYFEFLIKFNVASARFKLGPKP